AAERPTPTSADRFVEFSKSGVASPLGPGNEFRKHFSRLGCRPGPRVLQLSLKGLSERLEYLARSVDVARGGEMAHPPARRRLVCRFLIEDQAIEACSAHPLAPALGNVRRAASGFQ